MTSPMACETHRPYGLHLPLRAGVQLDAISSAPHGLGANIWAGHSTAGVSQSRGGAWQGCGVACGLDGLDHLGSTSRQQIASQAMWGKTSAQLVSPSVQRKSKSGRTKHTQDTDD